MVVPSNKDRCSPDAGLYFSERSPETVPDDERDVDPLFTGNFSDRKRH